MRQAIPVTCQVIKCLLFGLSMAVSAGLSGGCASLILLGMDEPHAKIKAEYQLPEGTLAIFIDDYLAPLEDPSLKRVICDQIRDELAAAKVKIKVVPFRKVAAVTDHDVAGRKLSIQRVGLMAGASHVLYINLARFDVYAAPGEPVVRPNALAYVKVIDVADGERLWPVRTNGREVSHQGRLAADMDLSPVQRCELYRKLARDLAHKVAVLFYEHIEQPPDTR